ncbi:MAG TPA: hypothetical protein PLK76_02000 [bacterium]|nr:hypothetical protein [bacterium]
MKNSKLILYGFLHSLLAIIYIGLVVFIMSNGEKIFSPDNQILGTAAFLLLFVVSATIMAGIILGKPMLLYFNNEKPAALKLFFYTLIWLIVYLVLFFLIVIIK